MMEGQKNLLIAVQLFNQRYAKSRVTGSAGLSASGASFTLNF
jgi:hypothetical protein